MTFAGLIKAMVVVVVMLAMWVIYRWPKNPDGSPMDLAEASAWSAWV